MSVKVLIVDDSAFMRNALTRMLSSDPEITIVGTARDGVEAIEKATTLKPDIITMDVEMPRMDGISALRHIMQTNPLPVIMVSSLTTEGAQVTLDALSIGAVDFIPKNLSDLSVNIIKIQNVLIEKIKHIAKKRLPRRYLSKPATTQKLDLVLPDRKLGDRRVSVVVIGASTGGPKALQEIIPKLPKNFPVPVLIAQHMPPNFTYQFAERLNQMSSLEVREAKEDDILRPGVVYIAPGRGNMRVKRRHGVETALTISDDSEDFIYHPSVDALMVSAANIYHGRTLGVILTGMGNDGQKGAIEIKKAGGRVIAQDEETCVVYGMPKAVVEAGVSDKVLPVEEIAGEIINSV